MTLSECYKLLGVSPADSLERIKESRNELIQVWHPDNHKQKSKSVQDRALEQTKLINLAYTTIINNRPKESGGANKTKTETNNGKGRGGESEAETVRREEAERYREREQRQEEWREADGRNVKENDIALNKEKAGKLWAYILFALALIYAISPIDLIPDIPVLGWFDDAFLLALAGRNLNRKLVGATNMPFHPILKIANRVFIALALIAISAVGIFGLLLYKAFIK